MTEAGGIRARKPFSQPLLGVAGCPQACHGDGHCGKPTAKPWQFYIHIKIYIYIKKQRRSEQQGCRDGSPQWCQRWLPALPTALCQPAAEPAGMGARGCARSIPPRRRDWWQLGASMRWAGWWLPSGLPWVLEGRGSARGAVWQGASWWGPAWHVGLVRDAAGLSTGCSPALPPALKQPGEGLGGGVFTAVTCSAAPSPPPVPQFPLRGSEEGGWGWSRALLPEQPVLVGPLPSKGDRDPPASSCPPSSRPQPLSHSRGCGAGQ